MQTPEQRKNELLEMGISPREVELFIQAYTVEYKEWLTTADDVLKTADALAYINKKLREAGQVRLTKHKLTITNLRQLTSKVTKNGHFKGKIEPIDLDPPKKTGYYFKIEELDKFIEEEIALRKVTKEELMKENELLKARIRELEQQLAHNKPKKAKNEVNLEAVSLSVDGQELSFTYNKRRFSALIDDGAIIGLEEKVGADAEPKPVSKQMRTKLEPAIIETLKNQQ